MIKRSSAKKNYDKKRRKKKGSKYFVDFSSVKFFWFLTVVSPKY